MPSEEVTSGLADRVASVGRRLTVRMLALGAVAGGVAGAGGALALAPGGVARVGLVATCAVVGAALANRLARGADVTDGAAWLDRRAGRMELIASGVAVADGRARRTLLAHAVIGSATERARAAGRPSSLPVAVAIAAIAMLAVATTWMQPRTERARPASETAQLPAPMVVARDGGDRGPPSSSRGAETRGDTTPAPPAATDESPIGGHTGDAASAGRRVLLAGRGADASGVGATAGAIISTDPTIAPALTSTELAVSAPRAGASADLAAVPPRYRALVTAYLEAR